MAAVIICSDFWSPPKSLSLFPLFPHLFAMKWWDQLPWSWFSECWVLRQRFYSPLSLSSKSPIVTLLFSAIRVVSSAYLRLLTFLLAILIPACASFSLAFHMMYSAYKLSNQGDNIQPWRPPLPIWNQSVVPCPVLTVASWPAYRFLKRQVSSFGIPISFRVFHSLFWRSVDYKSMDSFLGSLFWSIDLFVYFYARFDFFYWKIVVLQYCVGLCHISTWIVLIITTAL